MSQNPEIASSIRTGGFNSNVHDVGTGSGTPVLMIHGSGPGVSAWANWRQAIPALAGSRRVIAPDMVGFGYTDRPAGIEYSMDTWSGRGLISSTPSGSSGCTSSATPSAVPWPWPSQSVPPSGCSAWC